MHTPFMDKQRSPHRRDRDTVGGRLKQRLARILTRSTCTTNATAPCSSGGTGTAFVSLAKTNTNADSSHHREPEPEAPPSPYFCTPCTYERPNNNKALDATTRPRHHRRRHSRSASLVHISVDCTGGAGGTSASGRRCSVHSDAPLLLHHLMSSVPARDVVKKPSKCRDRSKPPAAAARSPSVSRRHCSSSSSSWGRARRPRPTGGGSTPTPAYSYSWSSSSSSSGSTATDDDKLAPFSGSDDEEEGGGGDDDELAETRTLFSSLSFSSDSTSEFYFYHHTNNNGGSTSRRRHVNNKQMMSRRSSRRAPRRALSRTSSHDPAPAPADAYFRPVVSVETKIKRRECNERNKEDMGRRLNDAVKKEVTTTAAEEETAAGGGGGAGMAVVKRSSNPYLDFRSSMVEMVVERRIGRLGKMEELLGSYLSLNPPRHHPAILAAFEDVWEAVLGEE